MHHDDHEDHDDHDDAESPNHHAERHNHPPSREPESAALLSNNNNNNKHHLFDDAHEIQGRLERRSRPTAKRDDVVRRAFLFQLVISLLAVIALVRVASSTWPATSAPPTSSVVSSAPSTFDITDTNATHAKSSSPPGAMSYELVDYPPAGARDDDASFFDKAVECLHDSPFFPASSDNDSFPTLQPTFRANGDLKSDLVAHYEELLNFTQQFRGFRQHNYAHYNGPWIENHWISRYCCDHSLEEFNGTIPLFVQWVDHFVSYGDEAYLSRVLLTLLPRLRRDVVYVTVSQCDLGIFATNLRPSPRLLANVLVVSAGGVGHVPIPLIARERNPKVPFSTFGSGESLPYPSLRTGPLISFAGTIRHGARKLMASIGATALNDFVANVSRVYTSDPGSGGENSKNNDGINVSPSLPMPIEDLQKLLRARAVVWYKGKEWESLMDNSWLNFAPRGVGRSSFHVTEIIQSGNVPVYVWDDEEWMPYRNDPRATYAHIGYSINVANLERFFHQYVFPIIPHRGREISNVEDWLVSNVRSRYGELKRRVEEVRQSHYTYEGVMTHISKFFKNHVAAALACQRHPVTQAVLP